MPNDVITLYHVGPVPSDVAARFRRTCPVGYGSVQDIISSQSTDYLWIGNVRDTQMVVAWVMLHSQCNLLAPPFGDLIHITHSSLQLALERAHDRSAKPHKDWW